MGVSAEPKEESAAAGAAAAEVGNPSATAAPSLSSFRSVRQVLQALGGVLLGSAHAPARSLRISVSPRRFVSCAAMVSMSP
jgi:hypothetical protein